MNKSLLAIAFSVLLLSACNYVYEYEGEVTEVIDLHGSERNDYVIVYSEQGANHKYKVSTFRTIMSLQVGDKVTVYARGKIIETIRLK